MTDLTPEQMTALRWLRDFPSTVSTWVDKNGKVGRGHPSSWTHLKLEGAKGSILIASDDVKALNAFIEASASGDSLFRPNKAGLAALTTYPPGD